MKKILSVLLVAILMAVSVPAFAENIRTSGDFEYKVKGNGTAEITGYIGEQVDIIIPTMIDGYMITSIGESAFACVEPIGLSNISVTIPDGVTSIGEKAFWMRQISSINLPDGLEYIGYGAFVGNNSCAFRISPNHPCFAVIDNSLYNKQNKELLHLAMVSGTASSIPEGIVSIGDYAGYYVSEHHRGETIACPILPSTIQNIGDYAFSGLKLPERKEFMIPSSVSAIGIGAFENCYGSINVDGEGRFILIPADSALRKIEDYSFKNTVVAVESVDGKTFIDNVTSIGVEAFCSTDIYCYRSNFVISAACSIISEGAFEEAHLMGWPTLVISEGVENIEARAFKRFDGVGEEVLLPSTLKYIGAEAFKEYTNTFGYLKNVYLPAGLEYIDITAFSQSVTYTVEKGSYAERWADENALVYNINGEEANLDWLN